MIEGGARSLSLAVLPHFAACEPRVLPSILSRVCSYGRREPSRTSPWPRDETTNCAGSCGFGVGEEEGKRSALLLSRSLFSCIGIESQQSLGYLSSESIPLGCGAPLVLARRIRRLFTQERALPLQSCGRNARHPREKSSGKGLFFSGASRALLCSLGLFASRFDGGSKSPSRKRIFTASRLLFPCCGVSGRLELCLWGALDA